MSAAECSFFQHDLCMKEWVANHYCGKCIGRKLTFIRLVSFDVGSSQMWQDFGLLHVIVLCIWTIGFVFRRFLKISSFGGKEIDFWFESSYKVIIFLNWNKYFYVIVIREIFTSILCVLLRSRIRLKRKKFSCQSFLFILNKPL